ncbi:MAG: PilN domain-containing protein [Coxiellaceae bacterium]|nr:PilN domain-containing protein [Coxiellaceae bacterium]
MTQNINLITELTIQPPVTLNSRLITTITTGWVILLFLIYVLTYTINITKQKELPGLELIQKNLIAKIEIYKQEFAILQKQSIDSMANIIGFHRYLEDLASLVPQGVWLNEITFASANNLVTIKGSTILASSVSVLINALNRSDNFRNKKFSAIHLQENSETHDTDFTISTVPITTDDAVTKKRNK